MAARVRWFASERVPRRMSSSPSRVSIRKRPSSDACTHDGTCDSTGQTTFPMTWEHSKYLHHQNRPIAPCVLIKVKNLVYDQDKKLDDCSAIAIVHLSEPGAILWEFRLQTGDRIWRKCHHEVDNLRAVWWIGSMKNVMSSEIHLNMSRKC